jgi:glucose dehydrogenase
MQTNRYLLAAAAASVLLAGPALAQHGATNGEWHYYGRDAGTAKYFPLDQINASNVKDLKIVWEWKAQNFGKRPDFNSEVTPLMANGVLCFTARIDVRFVVRNGSRGQTG